jgi:hypothetical protein
LTALHSIAEFIPAYLHWIVGILLLLAGRRLFWLCVALLGFVLGFYLAEAYLGPESASTGLALAVIFGVVAGVLAVMLQKLAVGVAGFAAGVYLVLRFGQGQDWFSSPWLWLVLLFFGLLGILLAKRLFELALVLVTSLVGSFLLVGSIEQLRGYELWALVFLWAVGVVVQFFTGGGKRKRRSEE